jgi:dTMP kinase
VESGTTRSGAGKPSRSTAVVRLRSITRVAGAAKSALPSVVGSRKAEVAAGGGPGGRARSRNAPGWFLAFEGGDGSGKSTQLNAVAAWLRGRGYDVVTTREPGGTPLGEELRDVLLRVRSGERLGARAEALLFAADRADHIEKVVRPALERGAIVLTDRHVDSSIAYQSGGRGLPEAQVVALSEFAVDGVRPDLTILLDVDHAVAAERAYARSGGMKDRLEGESPEFHDRVRESFKSRAAAAPAGYLVVDAAEAAPIITAIIQDHLADFLPPSPREVAKVEEARQAQREAEEAERREQEARRVEERAKAQREAELRAAEREAARKEKEQLRLETERAAERRVAEERAKAEREAAEQARRAEADRRAVELREAEERQLAQADADRRREAEAAVRQVEAAAKAKAKAQAARDLASRAESEARTARLVDAARREAAEIRRLGTGFTGVERQLEAGPGPVAAPTPTAPDKPASGGAPRPDRPVEKTAVLPSIVESATAPTEVIGRITDHDVAKHGADHGAGHAPDGAADEDPDEKPRSRVASLADELFGSRHHDEDEFEDYSEGDEPTRSRWRRGKGKK